ncbi:MAG: NADPH-quinone oxidoreductase [Ignavibacteriales bacterium CG07_land_8_20_14_0_80_59_12]|nr:MAG: NADPH-quinone oxidoreductase [Ignavibacteriales bacterium CG07_land_8_20_14_0_80_59_12]
MRDYFRNIYQSIWTVLVGMSITWRHLFVPAVTIQYPKQRRPIPERARNRLYVEIDDCIGCDQCSNACPVDCISIETLKALPGEDLGTTSGGNKKRLWVTKFDIDIAKCCFCGLCVPPCPTECIWMTDVFEYSEYDRKSLLYSFSAMTVEEVAEKKRKADEWAKEEAARKAAAAAAKAAAPAPAPVVPSDLAGRTPSTGS